MGLDEAVQALADPTRREVVRLLARSGPMTAGALAERFDLAKSTMSGHFNVLRRAGLIVAERQGTSIVYSASMSVLEETMATLMETFGVRARGRSRRPSGGGLGSGEEPTPGRKRETNDGESLGG